MQYFKECTTVEQIKTTYRKLAQQNHPDRGGDLETMKAINAQYHDALQDMDGKQSHSADGKSYAYKYNQEREQVIIDKIAEILSATPVDADINVLLIGRWVWIEGNTKPYKEALKATGCRWHSKRGVWYWKPNDEPRRRRSKGSLSDIAAAYGCERFARKQESDAVKSY